MITRFFDMSGGGTEKEDWAIITVNLPEEEAIKWFEDKFDHHPYEVTCDCCGQDYWISEYETLEEAIKNNRNYTHKHFTV